MNKGAFKDSFRELNSQLFEEDDLTVSGKKRLFQQTKMYIFIQDFLTKLTPILAEGEAIQAYLPLTNQENTAVATGGLLGMAYARTAAAREYVDHFHDVRGNRLLVFTNQRMLFLVMVEFLEEELFYSYPYSSIQSIQFTKHKIGYFDWHQKSLKDKRQYRYYYTLDFQSENHIFTEMLTVEDGEIVQRQLQNIPQLQDIMVTAKARRKSKLDAIFSNLTWQLKVLMIISLLLLALGVGYLLVMLAGALGWGPLKEMWPPVGMVQGLGHCFLDHWLK